MKRTIIDSHAHLGWDSFKEDRNDVIQRALDSGVVQIVQAGVDFKTLDEQLAIAEEYPFIFNGVGLHPHEAKFWDDSSSDLIKQTAKHKSIVGLGECGLDYYYKHSEPEVQKEVFRVQVRLARELNLPLIIHTRDAWPDTFEILKSEGKGEVRGVFHCFTGSPDEMPEIEKLDFYVSFSGIVTFSSAKPIQAAAPLVKSNRVLVETDCPYLAPQPYRGKRNEPSYVWATAEKVATLRRVSLDEMSELATVNARALFGLPVPIKTGA